MLVGDLKLLIIQERQERGVLPRPEQSLPFPRDALPLYADLTSIRQATFDLDPSRLMVRSLNLDVPLN